MKNLIEEQYIQSKAATRLYLEAEKDTLKLKLARRLTRLVSSSLVSLMALGFAALCLVLLLFALGFALGDYFQNDGLGFLCSSGAAILITLISIPILKKSLTKPILKITIKELFDE